MTVSTGSGTASLAGAVWSVASADSVTASVSAGVLSVSVVVIVSTGSGTASLAGAVSTVASADSATASVSVGVPSSSVVVVVTAVSGTVSLSGIDSSTESVLSTVSVVTGESRPVIGLSGNRNIQRMASKRAMVMPPMAPFQIGFTACFLPQSPVWASVCAPELSQALAGQYQRR